MPIGSHAELTEQDVLALASATAPRVGAVRGWTALMAEVPFDEINENTQRIMPAIFRNLRDVDDLPERDRMRGAFKYRWSRNTELLNGVRSVLIALGKDAIDYRLLKGAAVQATCDSLGSRVMGDVDVLIRRADVEHVIGVMTENGFRRGTYSACPAHPESRRQSALNFNRGDCHVDVHIAEFKEPSRLCSEMLRAPAVEGRAAGIPVLLPQPELLVLHAAVHGRLASGHSDYVQAVVDVAMLGPYIDPDRLVRAAQRTGTLVDVVELDAAVRRVGARPLGVRVSGLDHAVARSGRMGRQALDAVVAPSSLMGRIRVRSRDGAALAQAEREFNGRRHAYSLWLRLGKFAVAERAAVAALGGFLPEPVDAWRSGATVRPFEDDDVPGLTASTTPASALDWRFRVRFADRQEHARLRVASAGLDSVDAFVFRNGMPVTFIVAGDESSRDIYFRDIEASNEFSIRPLWEACSQCYGGLEDMAVRIDLGDDAR